jgi:hypothetical protein
MRLTSLCLAVMGLVLITCSTRNALADDGDLPRAVAPRLAVVQKVSEDSNTIVCAWSVSKPTLETITREKDGREVTEVRVAFVSHVTSEPYSLAKASFHDAEGSPVSREAFLSGVRPGAMIVISGDERPVDPAYLKMLKSDVLILVPSHDDLAAKVLRDAGVPAASAPPAGDAPPASATPVQ